MTCGIRGEVEVGMTQETPVFMAEREILVHNIKRGLMSYIRLGLEPDDKLERSSSKDYAVHKTPTTISFIRQSSEITTMYQHIKVPAEGQKITVNPDFSLNVPDNPIIPCLLYTSPSPRDGLLSRMPSSA